MKKVISILTVCLLISCETPKGVKESKDGYSIIEIDSCEYIEVSGMVGTQNGYYSLTHKGNCKFCAKKQ